MRANALTDAEFRLFNSVPLHGRNSMSIKHYDVVRAASPSDLAEKLTHKLKEGWQPYGGPVAITPYTLMQAVAIEGEPQVGPSSEPDWYYVIVLAGQSNAMAYGEGLPLPDSYDAPDPRIKQLARRSTVTPGGAACRYNDIISQVTQCYDSPPVQAGFFVG